MNVASKQLCQELYELSRWDAGDKYWNEQYVGIDTKWYVMSRKVVASGRNEGLDTGIPAYDLAYLLMKLPRVHDGDYHVTIQAVNNNWCASYDHLEGGTQLESFGDTPEDAACKIAIELFKQGVLKPSDKEVA
ncbi:hypothetical protein [Mycobacteroides abscessus]|uniref:hypothetical protein n=1 Tax=Mycobacteroides abscessus TaxID=36809 RepID=UPI000C266243|nr:hypothetical protein [Mycobacteroides abscessus]